MPKLFVVSGDWGKGKEGGGVQSGESLPSEESLQLVAIGQLNVPVARSSNILDSNGKPKDTSSLTRHERKELPRPPQGYTVVEYEWGYAILPTK